jgi:zinc protease
MHQPASQRLTLLIRGSLLIPAIGLMSPNRAAAANLWKHPARGSYAVVVSHRTYAEPAWRQVVDTLRTKHDGAAIVYHGSVRDTHAALQGLMPRYACFVGQPDEVGRSFVVDVHRLTRRLDDDPYTDVVWAILTGYDADDALRIARRTEPLIIRRILGGCSGVNLNAFDEGIKFNEGEAGGRWVKRPGEKAHRQDFPVDSTKGLVDALNEFRPDAFVTSGHATEKDWQIGYNYPDGSLRCKDGRLFGLDTKGGRHDIHSDNPKVFLPVGNCLIGHVPGPDCMALAMMRTAGVHQMFGYTAVTFFGYMGWGTRDLFESRRDRYTLAQACYFVNQTLVHKLETEHPRIARLSFETFERDQIKSQAAKLKLKDRDEVGLLWDRDVVAFYGDPAWEVRRPAMQIGWDVRLQEADGAFTLTIEPNRDGRWDKYPIMLFWPERLERITLRQGAEHKPVLTDNFVLVPVAGDYRNGESIQIVFEARRKKQVPTSATSERISVASTKETAAKQPAASPSSVVVPARVPKAYVPQVKAALANAGPNAGQLVKAIRRAPESQVEAVCFLVANMPEPDLQNLTTPFILENVAWAYKARATLAWGADIPQELFFNHVLPYASVNERRDNWRRDFYERFEPIVRSCRTPGEAALELNRRLFEVVGVEYHATTRPKPDQSPYESIEAGYASCTGLSVLLADACRAVCVPARLAGTPLWMNKKGNHTWVEVWDRQWHFLGAAEPDPKGLNHAWFVADAAKADPDRPEHRIYATSYRKTSTHFPLVWAPDLQTVSAVDVTAFYRMRRPVIIEVVRENNALAPAIGEKGQSATGDRNTLPPVTAVRLQSQGELYAAAPPAPNTENRWEFTLPVGQKFNVEVAVPDGLSYHRKLTVTDEATQKVTIQFPNPRRYVCHRAPGPIVIDGLADEPAWRHAPWTAPFVDISGTHLPPPRFQTAARMLWDDECLYINAGLEEPHVWATFDKRDQIVWHENNFEVFIDPNGDARNYYEIEINARNTIFDLLMVRTYRDGGPARHEWEPAGMQSAVHINGTLNDPTDRDKGWTVEFALPWSALAQYAHRPTPPRDGDTWRMGFSRVEWQRDIVDKRYVKVPDTPEDNWVWSPQGEINMHAPERWGYVTFSSSMPNEM